MAFIPVPDTVKISFVYNWQTEVCVNTMHWSKAGGYSAADMVALATELGNSHIATFLPLLSSAILLEEVNAVDLSDITGPSVTSTSALPSTGGVTTGSLPNNVAMCITRKTALRGRSYRGRMYVPGCPTAMLLSSTGWTGTARGNVASAYNDLILAGEFLGWTHVVVSYQNAGVVRLSGVATPVTSFDIDPLVDSQRRRLAGRGA
jgi:hypothetical protein